MGAALHFYAATGGQDSDEIKRLVDLFHKTSFGGVTETFLRSIANEGSPVKGDPAKREDHKDMATYWFGINRTQNQE